MADSDKLCPSCGALPSVWPPQPTGQPSEPAVLDAQQIKEEVGRGLRLGCLGTFAASLVTLFLFAFLASLVSSRLIGDNWALAAVLSPLLRYGLPLSAVGFAYFHLRPTRPHFARGLGYSALITAALFLGVFAVCR